MVIFNKYTIIENCIKRINSVYDGNLETLQNFDKQDIIVLNLQRACQAVIDTAKYIISVRNLDATKQIKEPFIVLKENNIINKETEKIMQYVIAFRNDTIYKCEKIDIKILKNILDEHLEELREFAREILKQNRSE